MKIFSYFKNTNSGKPNENTIKQDTQSKDPQPQVKSHRPPAVLAENRQTTVIPMEADINRHALDEAAELLETNENAKAIRSHQLRTRLKQTDIKIIAELEASIDMLTKQAYPINDIQKETQTTHQEIENMEKIFYQQSKNINKIKPSCKNIRQIYEPKVQAYQTEIQTTKTLCQDYYTKINNYKTIIQEKYDQLAHLMKQKNDYYNQMDKKNFELNCKQREEHSQVLHKEALEILKAKETNYRRPVGMNRAIIDMEYIAQNNRENTIPQLMKKDESLKSDNQINIEKIQNSLDYLDNNIQNLLRIIEKNINEDIPRAENELNQMIKNNQMIINEDIDRVQKLPSVQNLLQCIEGKSIDPQAYNTVAKALYEAKVFDKYEAQRFDLLREVFHDQKQYTNVLEAINRHIKEKRKQ